MYPNKVVLIDSSKVDSSTEYPLRIETNSPIIVGGNIHFVRYENQDMFISKINLCESELKIDKVCSLHGHILQLSMTFCYYDDSSFYVLRRTD